MRRTNPKICLLAALLALIPGAARASVPDWVRQAAQQPIPKYPEETKAVELLEEQVTTVTSETQILTTCREVYKILRPEGHELGRVNIASSKDMPVQSLRAWAIAADGNEYETKEKEAVKVSFPGGGILYEDDGSLVLRIPAADPGSIIAYEWTQRMRPYVLQDVWQFQSEIPVLRARYELQMPAGWEERDFWSNHAPVKAQAAGGSSSVWELTDISAIEREVSMPSERAVAGTMVVTFLPAGGTATGVNGSWQSLGQWYAELAQGRRDLTPDIKQKVAELTASSPDLMSKIRAVASYVQHDIRYVGVEIGIGGYQPHTAQDIFTNRYGDCKDKATLLSAMLSALDVDSYYVLVNIHRGVVRPDLPTVLLFDHAILAIHLPEGADLSGIHATFQDPKLGTLLFFDPTDPDTPIGFLPAEEQANNLLLIAPTGGEIVQPPLLDPPLNRLLREEKLQVGTDGSLSGAVTELYWGAPAAERRAALRAIPESERSKSIEGFVARFVPGLVFQGAQLQNLDDDSKPLVVSYAFLAKGYAQVMSDFLLVRPRVLGEKSLDLTETENKPRQYPVELDSTTLESDIVEITLPEGYQVEELPAAVDFHPAFGEYKTKVSLDKNVLRYMRTYEINQVLIPSRDMKEAIQFFAQIAREERGVAVLRRTASAAAPSAGGSQ